MAADSEKGKAAYMEDEETDENPADIQPRFFRTPSADLIPNAAVGAAVQASAVRRRSSIRLEQRGSVHRKKSLGGGTSPESLKGLPEESIRLRRPLEAGEPLQLEDDEEEVIRFGGPLTLEDVKSELRGLCTLETLRRKLPITVWLPKYSRTDLLGDVVAGLTVGLTVVPQCLAYAQIADIKLEYGLNSAYMGCFIYALLGTSKDVTVGPTAILSLLTGTFIQREMGLEGDWAILLCFFVGCFQLLMGFLRLGFLINFISTPVVSGFTQAAVIVIILSQVKNIMGVSFGSAKDNVGQTLAHYVRKMPDTRGWDVLMGCLCITLLLLMREMAFPAWKAREGRQHPPKWWAVVKEAVRLMNVSRYAIVVVSATIFEYVMEVGFNQHYLSVTGPVTAKISAPKPPNFAVENLSLGEILSTFGAGLVLVPLLATMESVAVAKTFAHKFRYNIDVTQEFIALGAANVVSSFFGAYPVTGAFTRSALNAESGVRTPMGCIVTGTFVVVAILSLGQLFQYIPKAALAAVIICACLTMFDFQIFKELWIIRKSELFVLILTMATCLFLRVEFGLIIGLTVSILMLVYPMARPVVVVQKKLTARKHPAQLDDYRISVKPQGSVFFPAAEYLKEIFNDPIFKTPVTAFSVPRESFAVSNGAAAPPGDRNRMELREALPPIIFDGIHLTSSDYSALRALRSVFVNCKSLHRDIVFVNTSDEILDIIMPFRRKDEDAEKKNDVVVPMHQGKLLPAGKPK
ncbi:Sodium-independent sulfate anion transporter [Hypsibius exemplaris]|uniref:Sodium-independent sulfate anion transporter n=1 Tax=Hypsibius exemplaris TaxID=2072580 RepID=A0A1W0WMP3_HYPEX|nr:Sodium-independent sulfate anion transporter [Hypsibius exemplaris]